MHKYELHWMIIFHNQSFICPFWNVKVSKGYVGKLPVLYDKRFSTYIVLKQRKAAQDHI